MALHDEEQRRLTEIERQLAEENPRLAQRLADFRPTRITAVALAVLGMLVSFTVGLITMAVGAQLSSPVLVIIGAVFTVVLPTIIIWRLWLRRLR